MTDSLSTLATIAGVLRASPQTTDHAGYPVAPRLDMQTDREDPPISSKSRPNADHELSPISMRDDGEPVSMSDIEMILAPGIAPPPLPAAAKEQARTATNAAKDVVEGGASKWSADAPALRRRRERSPALQAPDAVFQDIRFGAPKNGGEKDNGEADKGDEPARTSSPEVNLATNDQSAADLALMAALSPPAAAKPVIEEDIPIDAQDAGPPSGLLDVRNMIAMLEPSTNKKSVDDDFLNLSGGILELDPSASIFSPIPPPIDDGPRADEEAVLSLPDPPSEEKRLLAPVLPLPDEKAAAAEPEGMGLLGEAVARSAKKASNDKSRTKSSAKKKATSTPPPAAAVASAAPAEKSRAPWIIAAGALAVAGYVLLRPTEPAPAVPTTPAATAVETPVATPPVATTAEPAPTVAPVATVAAVDPGTPSPATTATAVDPGKTPSAAATTPKPEATAASTPAKTASPAPTTPPAATTAAPAATPTATQPPAASGREFNKGEASAALSSAAGAASGCRAPDDPSGTARVSVTFAPSGRVTSALINGPPFAGTPTGGCIARAFRGVSISPFDGGPVTVSKSLSIR